MKIARNLKSFNLKSAYRDFFRILLKKFKIHLYFFRLFGSQFWDFVGFSGILFPENTKNVVIFKMGFGIPIREPITKTISVFTKRCVFTNPVVARSHGARVIDQSCIFSDFFEQNIICAFQTPEWLVRAGSEKFNYEIFF